MGGGGGGVGGSAVYGGSGRAISSGAASCPQAKANSSSAWSGAIARSDAIPFLERVPLGRRADGPPPSRRVTNPTSRRVRKRQETELVSSAPTLRTVPDAPRERAVRTSPCSGFRLLSSPTHSHAWPFAVARANQVDTQNRNHPGSGRSVFVTNRRDWKELLSFRFNFPLWLGASEPGRTSRSKVRLAVLLKSTRPRRPRKGRT